MRDKLRQTWSKVSAPGERLLMVAAVLSPLICVGGLICMATGGTESAALRWIWRVSALISLCDALFGIGYGIAKCARRAIKNAPLAPQRRECRKKGHDWDGCICRRCRKKRNAEHDWERVCLDAGGCDTCPHRAGPGDWGMCMPETGDGCVRHFTYEDRCKKCGAVRTVGS